MKHVQVIRGLFAAAIMTVCATAANAQGKLEIVGGDTYDWGTVPPGKLTTVVEVKNVGSDDLKITEVRPACGCTAAPIDKNLLKPGEVGRISITLDVTTRSGPVEKTVSISSSDSAMAMRVLRLKANVKRPITVEPSQYFIVTNGVKGVEAPATSLKITNTSDAPITIYPPEFSQGNVKARFDLTAEKVLKPGESHDLKAFVTPLEEKAVYGSFKMKTTSNEVPNLDFSISGTMARPETSTQQGDGHQH